MFSYCNTILANLNVRQHVRGSNVINSITIPLETLEWTPSVRSPSVSGAVCSIPFVTSRTYSS